MSFFETVWVFVMVAVLASRKVVKKNFSIATAEREFRKNSIFISVAEITSSTGRQIRAKRQLLEQNTPLLQADEKMMVSMIYLQGTISLGNVVLCNPPVLVAVLQSLF